MIAKVCDRESRRDTWFENRLVISVDSYKETLLYTSQHYSQGNIQCWLFKMLVDIFNHKQNRLTPWTLAPYPIGLYVIVGKPEMATFGSQTTKWLMRCPLFWGRKGQDIWVKWKSSLETLKSHPFFPCINQDVVLTIRVHKRMHSICVR